MQQSLKVIHLTEHRSNKMVWQESQTRTGFSDEASGILLSEQLLQNIRPQFLQWCFLFDNENCPSHWKHSDTSLSFIQKASFKWILVSFRSSTSRTDSFSCPPTSSSESSYSEHFFCRTRYSFRRRLYSARLFFASSSSSDIRAISDC